MGRTRNREAFDLPTRVQLLEGDVDDFDDAIRALGVELSGMRKLLVGILVSVTTASILLVVNVLILGAR